MKIIISLALSFSTALAAYAQAPVWKKEQLMPTAELAEKINTNAKDKPIIFNVGPMDNIKGAISVGLGTSATVTQQMKNKLSMESKTRGVVIYCGCCSYSNCPNIKPAYDALIGLGFKNTKVLELPENLKPDWVAKDYPMEE
ncbi:MAG: rhodanese-like domain-containing protein [Bacteroidetes bacterium]|nr:rhodanese-like domain-containing protein [Bacteroidota bacterium]